MIDHPNDPIDKPAMRIVAYTAITLLVVAFVIGFAFCFLLVR